MIGDGPAGALATPALYRARGLDAIPPRGPLAAFTWPARSSSWVAGARDREGRAARCRSRALLGQRSAMPREGMPMTRSLANGRATRPSWLKVIPALPRAARGRRQAPAPGVCLEQPALAATLERSPRPGSTISIAATSATASRRSGSRRRSPVTRDDLERPRAVDRRPAAIRSAPARSTTRRRRPRASPR